MRIRQFVDAGLGNNAHMVISERQRAAILIDPLRDIDQYEAVARNRGCAHHARLRDPPSDIVGCPNSRV